MRSLRVFNEPKSPEVDVHVSDESSWNCCDPQFVKSVFNLKEVFLPFTWKKPIWWLVTSALLSAVIVTELTTNAFSQAANYENMILMGFIYGIEPLIQFLAIITAKYPEALLVNEHHLPTFEENFNRAGLECPQYRNPEVAIVIPTHLAADKIATTIRSCLQHVLPEQIFIIDNGNSPEPLDETAAIVAQISNQIHYIWGHIGNKTFAQYVGTLCAEKYKYIFTMDDDMRLPPNFSFGAELLNDTIKSVCYPIVAIHSIPGRTNLLIEWQSLEYKLSDCAKLSQAHLGGVLYPHGAASMWDRLTFLEVLKRHNAVFFAEDVQLGWLVQSRGFKMLMTAGSNLETEAPTSLFGKSPNFYQQRVRSWEMGRQVYFFKFLWQFLSVAPPTKSISGFFFFKLYEAYAVYTNIVDWVRLPLFILMITNEQYWIKFAIMTAISLFPVLVWNYIKLPINHRTDLQSSLLQILTFPFFKLLESAMSVGAILRLLYIFGPNYTRKPNVSEFAHAIINPDVLRATVEKEAMVSDLITYNKVFFNQLFPCDADTSWSSMRSANSSEIEDDPDVPMSPLNLPMDDLFDSANSSYSSSEQPEEQKENSLKPDAFFSPRRPRAKVNSALGNWLGTTLHSSIANGDQELTEVTRDLEEQRERHHSTLREDSRHFFFNRPNNPTSKGQKEMGDWLGSKLAGTVYQTGH